MDGEGKMTLAQELHWVRTNARGFRSFQSGAQIRRTLKDVQSRMVPDRRKYLGIWSSRRQTFPFTRLMGRVSRILREPRCIEPSYYPPSCCSPSHLLKQSLVWLPIMVVVDMG